VRGRGFEKLFNFGSAQGIGVVGLPQKVTCSECNYLLYEGDILRSPQDIMKKYDGRCPNCNRKLGFTGEGVSILPCEDDDRK